MVGRSEEEELYRGLERIWKLRKRNESRRECLSESGSMRLGHQETFALYLQQ